MRLGIYGGSFDPVHYGHLLLAETVREQSRLDEIWFMPAAQSPHKQGQPPTPPEARVEMLELAIAGHESFQASRLEIERGGLSYTVETLRRVAEAEPTAEQFLLMGADSLVDFPHWKSPAEICELATLLVVGRPGSGIDFSPLAAFLSPDRCAELESQKVQMPQLDISSSVLRDRVAAGKSIRYQTPRSVEKYIESQQLYDPTV